MEHLNTSNLYAGKQFDSLRELGYDIGDPLAKGGKQRTNQLEQWSQSFSYKKIGNRKIEITAVFDVDDESVKKKAVEPGSRGKYPPHIKAILNYYCSRRLRFRATHKRLLFYMGVVGEKYGKASRLFSNREYDKVREIVREELAEEETVFQVDDYDTFFRNSWKVCQEIRKSMEKALDEKVFHFSTNYMLVGKIFEGRDKHTDASTEEKEAIEKIIDFLSKYILGYESEKDLIAKLHYSKKARDHRKLNEYYMWKKKLVTKKLHCLDFYSLYEITPINVPPYLSYDDLRAERAVLNQLALARFCKITENDWSRGTASSPNASSSFVKKQMDLAAIFMRHEDADYTNVQENTADYKDWVGEEIGEDSKSILADST